MSSISAIHEFGSDEVRRVVRHQPYSTLSVEEQSRYNSSANHAPTVHATEASSALLLLERIPKAKRLIASTSNNDLSIWAHGQVEYTIRVTRQRDHLLHAWILPDNDLILAVTMRGDNFVAVLGPC